jgi:signal transduction histidine kinase
MLWPTYVILLFLLILAVYSGRRRSVPGALPFAISCILSALWVAAVLLEGAAGEPGAKVFWIKVQQVFQLPSTISITCFLLEYVRPGRWINRRSLTLLAIAPILFLGLGLTNEFHHLLWLKPPAANLARPLHGPFISVFLLYSYGFVLVNFAVYGWLLLKSPDNRWPAAFMLTGTLAARSLFLLHTYQLVQTSLPLDVLSIGLIYLTFAISLFFFGILDPTKLARQQIIAQMHEGVLVLDLHGRVANLNPAAQRLLDVSEKQALGRPIQEILPVSLALTPDDLQTSHPTEFHLGTGAAARYYSLSVSILKEWRGMPAGHLLLLYDISELKQAQAQLIDQGRTLAVMEERQNLARDLHDSTGQVLGYVGFQVDAARQLYISGRAAAADAQLARLAAIVQDAHADVREFILNLRMGPSPQQTLLPALQQYLENFTLQNDIEARLTIAPGVNDACLDWQVSTHVFRIVQEALSNARKHAKAKRIEVSLEAVADCLRVTTRDDGCGFDLQQTIQTNRFGLVFMHERAAKLGGSLTIQSAPGVGACITLEIPLHPARLYENSAGR